MKFKMKFLSGVLALLTLSTYAFATYPTLIFKNQFGEQINANVLSGTFIGNQVAANTVLSNLTGSTAYPLGNTYAAVSAKLTPAMLLTGFVSGAGTVAATDTVLQGFNKLSGNTQNLPVISNVLTGFVSGAGAVTSADTVLTSLQKVSGNTQNKRILTFTSAAGSGGAATEAMTVTGLAIGDTILAVSQSVKGANSLPLLGFNTLTTNSLTAVWSADPGASSVIIVTVLR